MRNFSIIALFALLVTGFSRGQQSGPFVHNKPADVQPERVKVYSVGPGVTAPELLPLDLSPISTEKCKKKVDGKVKLTLFVDTEGKPRNIEILEPLYTGLEKLAFKIVGVDRFNPGTYNGAPVVVAESVEVNMHACAEQTNENVANKTYRLRLRSQPRQMFGVLQNPLKEAVLVTDNTPVLANSIDGVPLDRAGNGVSPPEVLKNVPAQFSDEAREAKFQGVCILSVIVDTERKPRNIQVVRRLGMGLDEKAIEAVSQYRFKPAMKNGVPVPVRITVEVHFRLI